MASGIAKRFGTVKLSDPQQDDVAKSRMGFIDLVDMLVELLPEGREKALVFTKLEEAAFFSVAAIARRADPSD